MRQVLFTIPGLGVPVYGYGLMLFFAFLGSMHLAARRARSAGLDPEVIHDLALWMFVGGLAGARALYVWQYWGTRIQSAREILEIWKGGIVFYGSVLGGAAAFFLYWALRRFPLRPVLDAVAPALALGIALGRVGCFLNGCCYGDLCGLPWGVRFPGVRWFSPAGSPPWSDQVAHGLIDRTAAWSLPVHPTQLYSALDGLVLLALLSAYYPLRRRDGEVMALMMVTYPVTRFLIEYLRNDEAVFVAGMTISQSISVALLAGGLAFWYGLGRLPRGRFADAAGPADAAEVVAAPASR
ncbi:MAG TPA: prolipoprotein diacylglyceryl transferase [Isosphaeraceae bacterium]